MEGIRVFSLKRKEFVFFPALQNSNSSTWFSRWKTTCALVLLTENPGVVWKEESFKYTVGTWHRYCTKRRWPLEPEPGPETSENLAPAVRENRPLRES